MAIIGFNFTKMNIEKKKSSKGKLNITSNVSFKDVSTTDLSFAQNEEKGLNFKFEYVVNYEPGVGLITLNGEVITLEQEKKREEILKKWEKDKTLTKEQMAKLLNYILGKCNVEALILSRDVNLPPPIRMPEVGAKDMSK